MLVPAMHSTGTRSRSSTFSTPTCAAPRAPPPPRTRQVLAWALVARRSRMKAVASRRIPVPSPPLRSRGGSRASETMAQESSVDRDALAGDIRRRGQAQESDRTRDLLRLADAAHRRAVDDLLEVAGIGEHVRGPARADVPGRDRVDADAVAGPLDREVARELLQRG